MPEPLDRVVAEARACTVCAEHLPLGPRPILSAGENARIALIGQAPGTRVHASGRPWDDDSGERLCGWLGVTHDELRDPDRFAIVPMGFCYPGKRKGGDAPPRPECAPLWHSRLLAALPKLELKVLIGMHAQRHYLPDRRRTLTETVRAFERYLPAALPIPHPAWRSRMWMTRNPWFEAELLPVLRARVRV